MRFTDFPDPIIPIIDSAPEIRYNRENAFRARVHSDKELSQWRRKNTNNRKEDPMGLR